MHGATIGQTGCRTDSISTGSLSPESKRLEEEAEQWPPSSVKVNKEWRYNLHSSVRHHTVHRELISRFTFMLFYIFNSGIDYRWCHWGFFSVVPFEKAMCPEVDSASENEYKGFLLG